MSDATERTSTGTPRRIEVRVHPGASRARLEWDGAVAQVWVTAPAAEGAANRAVVAAVADWLGVAPSRVVILRGTGGRTKLLEVFP